MTAAHLEQPWSTEREIREFMAMTTPDTARLGVWRVAPGKGGGNARCPECHSIIYSRRHKLCGVCNHPLPERMLFTAFEAERVESLLSRERERHKRWMAQR